MKGYYGDTTKEKIVRISTPATSARNYTVRYSEVGALEFKPSNGERIFYISPDDILDLADWVKANVKVVAGA